MLRKDFFFITCSNGQQTPCMAAVYGEKDRRSKHNGCKLYKDSIDEEVRRNGRGGGREIDSGIATSGYFD